MVSFSFEKYPRRCYRRRDPQKSCDSVHAIINHRQSLFYCQCSRKTKVLSDSAGEEVATKSRPSQYTDYARNISFFGSSFTRKPLETIGNHREASAEIFKRKPFPPTFSPPQDYPIWLAHLINNFNLVVSPPEKPQGTCRWLLPGPHRKPRDNINVSSNVEGVGSPRNAWNMGNKHQSQRAVADFVPVRWPWRKSASTRNPRICCCANAHFRDWSVKSHKSTNPKPCSCLAEPEETYKFLCTPRKKNL